MTENNEAAAPAAADETNTGAAEAAPGATTDAVVHPTEPEIPVDPVPEPPHGLREEVSEAEIVDLRESALEDDRLSPSEEARVQAAINLSEDQASNQPVRYATPEEERQINEFLSAHYDRAKELLDSGMDPVSVYNQIQREVSGSSSDPFRNAPRVVTLGETVYYGDGSGAVHPAMVVHVYDLEHVDLQVFKRKHICDVENVAKHNLEAEGALNGWVYKA